MRPIACRDCGNVYQAESNKAPCPRCAKIDAVLVAPEEPPPPLVIPGPPSNVHNTLSQTSAPQPDLDRFMARPAPVPAPEPIAVVEDVECPRCAELIKVRAKACRFCGAEFEVAGSTAPVVESRAVVKRPSSGRHRVVERVEVVHTMAGPPPGPSPGVAAVLSFLIPGLGQIYAGQVGRGIAFFFGCAIAWSFAAYVGAFAGLVATRSVAGAGGGALLGGLAAVGLWVFNIVDAMSCANSGPGVARGVARGLRRSSTLASSGPRETRRRRVMRSLPGGGNSSATIGIVVAAVLVLVVVLAVAMSGGSSSSSSPSSGGEDPDLEAAKRRLMPTYERLERAGVHVSDEEMREAIEMARREEKRAREARERAERIGERVNRER